MSSEKITRGSRVGIHYEIRLEDGTVADSNFTEAPLEFHLGDGTLQQGLEEVLMGLSAGEEKTATLEPLYAFGFADPDAVHQMPRSDFPDALGMEPGSIVSFETPAGEEVPGIVKAIDDEHVTVDFSHPLAGHTITFRVKIVEVDSHDA